MPLLLAFLGLGGVSYLALKEGPLQSAVPVPDVSSPLGNISPLTVFIYAAGGLSLFWLYNKAKNA